MTQLLMIFDMDGTLVDSEILCNQAFLDVLPQLDEPVKALVQRYRGTQLNRIMADLAERIGEPLPDDFEACYRQRVSRLFATRLQAIPGAADMLRALPQPRCVASNGPLVKVRQALRVTGLDGFFGDALFSAYDVGAWKPDPRLFLHAAAQMGFAPEHCIVVEDSQLGIAAARAAGMHALHYHPEGVAAPGAFTDMAQLPALVGQIAAAR